MGKGLIAGIALAVIIIGFTSVIVLSSYIPQGDDGVVATLVIDITTKDLYAGGLDAATTMVDIYKEKGGLWTFEETVTVAAAQTATAFVYTSYEVLKLKIYDSSDTSLCTKYLETTVPLAYPTDIEGQAFQMELTTVDKGDTAKDILIKDSNNTAFTASTTILDVTNNVWNTYFATIDIEVRGLDDDSGYVNSHNFLRNYDNNHYLVISASGTGWDACNLNNNGWSVFDKSNVRYFVRPLSDSALTRDKQSTGEYIPDGKFSEELSFDFTGFESGDNVTLTYQYRWYSSMSHFDTDGNWGSDTATTSEFIYIQY